MADVQLPDVLYFTGHDKVWSELGDTVATGRFTGCAAKLEDAERACKDEDDWYMPVYPNSGKVGKKYYPARDE